MLTLDEFIKKKKKEQEKNTVKSTSEMKSTNNTGKLKTLDEFLASKSDVHSEKQSWFNKDAFSNIDSVGDAVKTVIGSAGDISRNINMGMLGMVENTIDTGAYLVGGVGGLLGNDKVKNSASKFIGLDLIDEEKLANEVGKKAPFSVMGNTAPLMSSLMGINDVEDVSVWGEKTDSLAQSGGQLAGTMALQSAGVPWWLTTGVTSFGGATEEAINDGADYKGAGLSALVTAGADILTEKLSGGIKFGGKALDDVLLQPLTKKISNRVVRTLANVGLDAAGEGFEEVAASVLSNLGTKFYKDESIKELLFNEDALNEYVDSFVGGALLGGGMGSVNAARSIKSGRDYKTGLTENEQKVVDAEVQSRIAEKETGDKKLSGKEKAAIEEQVKKDLERGYISIDSIESALGGDTYNSYKKLSDEMDEYNSLNKIKTMELTGEQSDRLAELKEKNNTASYESEKARLKKQLSQEVDNMTVNDAYLRESYNEKSRRGQKYTADLSKYDEEQQATIQRAIDSGILNNTNRTHEFVDMIAKISADKGVSFNFTDNQKLKESGFALEGKIINGYVENGEITLNLNSSEVNSKVVGHEITHVLEGTEYYDQLKETVIKYAKSKGEYTSRVKSLIERYRGVDDADIEEELTADLVGDYLFTDEQFINNLSAEQPNIFKKIYEEIKYLVKVATAGSKEAKQLEQVKRAFEKAYKENVVNIDSKIKRSLNVNYAREVDAWYNDEEAFAKSGGFFKVGRTSEALKSIGIKEQDILFDKSKIKTILNSHKGMNIDLIKEVPNIVENPVIIMQSKTVMNSITLLGEVYSDGVPVMVAMQLKPKGNSGRVLNLIKISSAYENSKVQGLIDSSDILYVDANKNRTDTWLRALGLQLPSGLTEYGSINNVTYYDDVVKIENVGKNEMAKAIEKAMTGKQQFSLSEDTKGRTLSKEQQDYLVDSKVRDENGALKVMYHGTPNGDFTVFKDGTYFTENKEYADRYQSPSASSLSSGKVASSPKTFEVYLNITKPFDINDAEAREIYINDYIKGGNAIGINPYLSEAEYAKIDTIDWTEGEDLRDFLIEEGYDYDGLVLDEGADGGYGDEVSYRGKSYVVFNSNQVKAVDNSNPTDNPDINMSLSNMDEEIAPIAPGQTRLRDMLFEAPTAEDIATSQEVSGNETINPPTAEDLVTLNEEHPVAEKDYSPNPENFGKPITSVKERNAAKLENLKVQLEKKQKLAEESKVDRNNQIASEQAKIERLKAEKDNALKRFNDEINKLEREYAAKKDVNTQTAEKIQRRIIEKQNARDKSQPEYDIKINKALNEIERLKRMRDNEQADAEKSINDMKARIDKMESDDFKVAEQRITKHQEHRALFKELMGDTSTWKDKKLGWQYRVNTLRRNLRDIVKDEHGNPDFARADALYEELQGRYNHNEALLNKESNKIKQQYAAMKINKYEDAYIQMLGEYRSNPDTTIKAEDMTEYFEKYKDKIDTVKVDKAIEMARRTYDTLFRRVNDALAEQGFKKMEYRQGYFPHFTENQHWLAKLFNWKLQDNTIPTDIAGLTEMFQPERSWQSFSQHRTGDATDYSFTKGLDSYVKGALDWIYHIDDIQRRRAFENEIRYQHSEQGVQDKIEEIMANESYDTDEAQRQIDLVYENARNPLNNFVQDLRTGTNNLAGKKDTFDREMETSTNRHVYSVMTNISNRISANMVGGSISSALTNFIPITQSWGEVRPVSTLKAIKDTVKSIIKDDGMIDKSDFMTNRLNQAENLNKSAWDKVSDAVGILMEGVDNITTQTVWRSKYMENIKNGMSETEAIKNADLFAEGLMAGRSRGNMPTIFNAKNPLTKTLTAFQLEVANQYNYLFKDLPQNIKDTANSNLVKSYVSIFAGAYAYNMIYSNLVGRDAALDPFKIIQEFFKDLLGDDDEEGDVLKALAGLGENVAQELPFVGGLLGGGRIPISNAMPFEGDFGEFITALGDGDGNTIAKEMLNPLVYLGLPVGGGQIKKTVEGLSMFDKDLPVSGSYTDSGNLRFKVDDTPANKIQAALFGQWASKNARDYFDNERQTLKSKQIEELAELDLPMKEYWEYRDGLKEKKTLEDKFDYIAGLDLPVAKKNIMINNIVQRDEEVDLSNYDDFADYEEFDFYFKNKEKYEFLQNNKVSYEEYTQSDESKAAYDWAYKNPEKYLVSKAIMKDIVQYRKHTTLLSNIKADKDKTGKTISGSRKDKVVNYLNELDIDYGARMIMYKMEYPSDNTYNNDIVSYLDSRTDISYQDTVAILKELGFTVDENGNVRW